VEDVPIPYDRRHATTVSLLFDSCDKTNRLWGNPPSLGSTHARAGLAHSPPLLQWPRIRYCCSNCEGQRGFARPLPTASSMRVPEVKPNAGYFQCELRSSQDSTVASISSAAPSVRSRGVWERIQSGCPIGLFFGFVGTRLSGAASGVGCLPTADERIRQLIASW
jgi:hypothetical protein